jgi:hypothetical protein
MHLAIFASYTFAFSVIQLPTVLAAATPSLSRRELAHGTCTYHYKSIKGSCSSNIGSWRTIDYINSEPEARRKAQLSRLFRCSAETTFDIISTFPLEEQYTFCRGDPTCLDDIKPEASVVFGAMCRLEERCVCHEGRKMWQGMCEQIVCAGSYVVGESWRSAIHGGWIWHYCKADGKVEDAVHCNFDTPLFDGAHGCWSTVP